MQKLIRSFYKSSLVTSVVLFVIGMLLLFKSDDTIIFLSFILGGILLVLGIIAVINFFRESSLNPFNDLNIVYGIVTVLFGILIISNPTVIATFIPFVVGVGILINSSIKLAYSIELRNKDDDVWKSTLVMASISTVCGMLILFNPFKTSVFVFKIIGLFIMIYSLLDIISIYKLKKNFHEIGKEIEVNNSVVEDAEVIKEENKEEKNDKAKSSVSNKKNSKSKKDSSKDKGKK